MDASRTQRHLPAIAVLAVSIALASFLALPMPLGAVACGLGWAMAAIAYVDARRLIVPDALSLPAIPAGLLASGRLLHPTEAGLVAPAHVVGLVAGGLSFYAIRWAYGRWRGREGLGLGDVKLAAAAGAWTGWEGLPDVVLLACVGALTLLAGLALSGLALSGLALSEQGTAPGRRPLTRSTRVPLGAFLAPAIWLVWALAQLGLAPHMLWGGLGLGLGGGLGF